jgi:hypothetical protein
MVRKIVLAGYAADQASKQHYFAVYIVAAWACPAEELLMFDPHSAAGALLECWSESTFEKLLRSACVRPPLRLIIIL